MDTDIRYGCLVEFRDECLGEPDGLFFEPNLNTACPVFGLVKEDPGTGHRFRNWVIAQSFTAIASLVLTGCSAFYSVLPWGENNRGIVLLASTT